MNQYPERDASRERTEDVAEELDAFRRVQFGRVDRFLPAPERDRRAAGRAQVADPVDLAPRRPDPTPARDLDDCHGFRPRSPLTRPRRVMSPLKPSGTPAARRDLAIGAEEGDARRRAWRRRRCEFDGHVRTPSVALGLKQRPPAGEGSDVTAAREPESAGDHREVQLAQAGRDPPARRSLRSARR